jgi:Peptidase family M28
MNKKSILYKTLCRALSLKRPDGGEGAMMFTGWLCDHIPAHLDLTIDAAGNIHVDNRTSTHHRTLFIAHVDTVHHEDGPNKFIKAHGKWFANGAPLGADDGAGCAMLMHLLHSGVAGYYVFSQGEECGGVGAKHLAKHHVELLKQFDRAIAFDRRGIDSVITHQGWGRCCSDVFADALSNALNVDERLMYLPDNTGVYTDTAEFTDIIPECTNISVGYHSEHTQNENLDIHHYTALSQRVTQINWDTLPTDRDPSVQEMNDWDSHYNKGWTTLGALSSTNVNSSSGFYEHFPDDDERIEVEEAIYDAMAGYDGWLIDLMAESVYPEDPEQAKRFINKKKLRDPSVLTEALELTHQLDAGTALATLFDLVYKEYA